MGKEIYLSLARRAVKQAEGDGRGERRAGPSGPEEAVSEYGKAE